MEIRPTYLISIAKTTDNSNKYYNCFPNGDTFTVKYGRVGGHEATTSYPMSKWDTQINSKLKKGYVDRTDLMQEVIEDAKIEESPCDEYKGLKASIANIIKRLQEFANNTIKASYRVTASVVTQTMVDKAQDKIDFLSSLVPQDVGASDASTPQDVVVSQFNNNLIELFEIIPRKMAYVPDNLAKKVSDFAEIVNREQSLLDTMSGQIYKKKNTQDVVASQDDTTKDSILNKMGITMEDTTDEDVEIIKKLLGDESKDRFVKAWRVTNLKSEDKYNQYIKDNNIANTKLLFHGTRSCNVFSILRSSLVLRPTNVVINGHLYGVGIYFAPRAKKSIGYTSVSNSYWANGNDKSGFLIIFETAYGTPYDVYDYNSQYGSMNQDRLQQFKKGANCLHAHAGASMGGYSSLKNDEIIFYKEEAVHMKYLVEIK